jgi:hypothetical protein
MTYTCTRMSHSEERICLAAHTSYTQCYVIKTLAGPFPRAGAERGRGFAIGRSYRAGLHEGLWERTSSGASAHVMRRSKAPRPPTYCTHRDAATSRHCGETAAFVG